MGIGALLFDQLIPTSLSNPFELTPSGPSAIFVTLRNGMNSAASLRSLNKIAATLTLPTNLGVAVLSVQHPAEIINYRSTGSTFPVLLAVALAIGAVTALGLTLLASVRRRRRDLALLKTFGFTRRQLAATVAWQSSVSVGIGAFFGVPLGVVFGRILWDLFAHEINAVPAPSIPAASIVLIAIGSLVVANLVAAVPGRMAARTPTALLLRAE
jgi:ABC-type antimicrobial peptide transport system permease subunit